jgi:hypothetical protein
MLPCGSKVMPCACSRVESFEVKSAGAKRGINQRPVSPVPWMTQASGAQFQDKIYGVGQRLHNIGSQGNKGKSLTATCTVCGKNKLI